MQIKIFTLAFESNYGGFDDSEVQEFLKNQEVLSVSEHFFMRNDVPYLTFVIKCDLRARDEVLRGSAQTRRDESWRDGLTESDLTLFEELRRWRGKRCREEGVPPYVLFTNKQLAQIAKERPSGSSELGKIEGLGRAKLEKYGKDLLELTASAHPAVLQ